MIRSGTKSFFKYLPKAAWALFLLFLPVTSFPYFPPTIGGNALVRPLSLYPLIILLILVTIPYLFKKPIYPTLLTLIPFILVVFLSTMLAFFQGIQPALGISVPERSLRALITLGVGAGIYLTVSVMPRSLDDLRASLRWLYAGFFLAFLWGSLQAVYVINFERLYYRWLNRIQSHISIRRLFTTRVSGLTYEPNWFAEQITILLLPWLLASVITGRTVFRWRWRWLTGELIMLAWSVFVLAFTFSRAGLIVFFILALISLLFLRPIRAKTHIGAKITIGSKARRLIEIVLTISILTGFIYAAGLNNEFFSRIWTYWTDKKYTSISGYLDYLGFGARFSYGETALNIFEDHPTLGVGLGNYAFHFDEYLPDEPIAALPEVMRLVTPEGNRNRLVTPKNFYLRLLAETGVVGLAAFLAFLLAVLGCALFLWLSPARNTADRFWGTAGILGIISFSVGAVSFDSFAIPNIWVVFGLITASTWIIYDSRRSKSGTSTDTQPPIALTDNTHPPRGNL